MSKKKKIKKPKVRRKWGNLNPITKVFKTDKAYNRKKNKEITENDMEE